MLAPALRTLTPQTFFAGFRPVYVTPVGVLIWVSTVGTWLNA